MLRFRTNLWLVLLAAMAMAIAGCSSSDDDNNPTGPGGGSTTQPSFFETVSNAPDTALALSGNAQCEEAAFWIRQAQSLSNSFAVPSGAAKEQLPSMAQADSVVYSWTVTGVTTTMVFKETATSYIWYITKDGTDTEDGATYNNFLMVEALEYKNGSGGFMNAWSPEDGSLLAELEWATVSGVFTMTMTFYDYDETYYVELTVYADGSGRCETQVDGATIWWVTWNAAGTSGEYYADGYTGTWIYTG